MNAGEHLGSGPSVVAASRSGYRRFARVAWGAGPVLSTVTLVAVLVSAAAPLLAATAIGTAVSRVAAAAADGPERAARAAMGWALAVAALFLVQQAATAVRAASGTAIGDRVDVALQRELMSAVLAPPGVRHMEDPHTADLVHLGRETFRAGWARPGRLGAAVSGLITARLMLTGAVVIVARFHLVLAVALLASGLWAAYEDKVASRQEAAHHYGSTELSRRTEYYYELGAAPPAAKEVRVFGLSGFLLDRFFQTWRRSMAEVFAPAGRRPIAAAAVLGAVVVAGLVLIGRQVLAGDVGAGAATIYAQALLLGVGGVQQSSWTGLQSELALASLRRFDEAVATLTRSAAESGRGEGRPAEDRPGHEIRFERVSFVYPGGTPALNELDLVVPAGRSLAVVGANGAGKTTLIKLLCRLYEPAGGRITVDGVDIRDLDLAGWRRRIAVTFQDTTRFHLDAHTNIAFGSLDAFSDRAGVQAAAGSAGVADTLDALPRGWDTPLSSEYDDGVDLSGGEWQRVGLARALFAVRHGSGVLILDEPAAHLDARAEAQLYQRFLALTAGLTTVVISHRFSTVRQASSIVVLDGGRVVEQGTHEELLARAGAYAEMFRLQAARFADSVAVSEA